MIALQTKNLTLTPCSPTDRDDFVALEQDPEVMRFLNGGLAVEPGLEPAEASFLMPRGTETYVWTARHRLTGEFVGWFCLWPEGEGTAELGYRLRRSAWGQGLASEGARALIGRGFEVDGYGRIVACTMVVNLASRRVMEKAGLRHVRTVPFVGPERYAGCEEGEVWYEVLRTDWGGVR